MSVIDTGLLSILLTGDNDTGLLFLLLAGGLLVIVIPVIIAVISAVTSAVAAETDNTDE